MNYINPFALHLKCIAEDLGCSKLAGVVLDNPRFPLWAGASKPHQHHYGKGRLAEHVLEVTEIALQNNEYFEKVGKGVDKVKLYLACLYHDVGKLWDYEPVDDTYVDWRGNEHRHMIHHISRSGLVWCDAAKAEGWKSEDIDEVWHCILSHHGLKEWGSPVPPQTRMAWLLHLADGLSARLDDFDKRKPFSLDPK
jgi:3'-5' exoribonuclease